MLFFFSLFMGGSFSTKKKSVKQGERERKQYAIFVETLSQRCHQVCFVLFCLCTFIIIFNLYDSLMLFFYGYRKWLFVYYHRYPELKENHGEFFFFSSSFKKFKTFSKTKNEVKVKGNPRGRPGVLPGWIGMINFYDINYNEIPSFLMGFDMS